MPIGRSRQVLPSQMREKLTVEAYNVTQGGAVALVDDGGTMKLLHCSNTTYAEAFYGFSDETVVQDTIFVYNKRGARVTPLVENDDPLVPGDEIWLSATAGRVTQTCPSSGSILKLGVAISTTEMVLIMNPRNVIG